MWFLINGILLSFILATATAYYNNYRPLISKEAEFALFGNITNFQDLLSVSLDHSERLRNDDFDDKHNPNFRRSLMEKEIETLDSIDDFERKHQTMFQDMKDYNDVTKDASKFMKSLPTRRKSRHSFWTYGWKYGKYEDSDDEKKDAKWQGYIEEEKLDMLGEAALQFLVHTRVKTKEALNIRAPFRGDKRYMLGYLFNRVRRILYDQRKIISAGLNTINYETISRVRATLRLYQQVVRYDIDLMDLERYIRRVYLKHAKFDHYRG